MSKEVWWFQLKCYESNQEWLRGTISPSLKKFKEKNKYSENSRNLKLFVQFVFFFFFNATAQKVEIWGKRYVLVKFLFLFKMFSLCRMWDKVEYAFPTILYWYSPSQFLDQKLYEKMQTNIMWWSWQKIWYGSVKIDSKIVKLTNQICKHNKKLCIKR